jgi:hypothetical protein
MRLEDPSSDDVVNATEQAKQPRRWLPIAALVVALLLIPIIGRCFSPVSPDQPPRTVEPATITAGPVPTITPLPTPTGFVIVPTVPPTPTLAATSTSVPPTMTATAVPTVTPIFVPRPRAPVQIPSQGE